MKNKNQQKYKQLAEEWFLKGNHDIETAQLLFDKEGYNEVICFHIHQAIEKYLKGFLVYNGVRHKRIHDLEELIKACGDIDSNFLNFLDECSSITEYYFESRYPLGDIINYPLERVKESLDAAYNIIGLIDDKMKAGNEREKECKKLEI